MKELMSSVLSSLFNAFLERIFEAKSLKWLVCGGTFSLGADSTIQEATDA